MSVRRQALRRGFLFAVLTLSHLSQNVAVAVDDHSPAGEPVAISPETTEFLRATILLLVPRSIVDEDGWGQTKRVQSGLNVRLDGLQLRTSRRWKDVKHGKWNRVKVTLPDPAERFDLSVAVIPQDDAASGAGQGTRES